MHVIMTSALCEPQAIIPPANQPTNFTCNWPTNQPEALLRKQPTNRSLKVEVGWLVATLLLSELHRSYLQVCASGFDLVQEWGHT
jgi:hypothetical protein